MIKAIIISKDCPHCEPLQNYLKEKGWIGKVKIINVDTAKGAKFANDNDIRYVPECVVIEKEDGTTVRACTESEFKKLLEEGK